MKMNGHILQDFPISVDCFLKRTLSYVKLYFLTHAHSDHTVGLSSSWKCPIYCTYNTANLVKHKFDIPPGIFHVLEVNESYTLICGYSYVTVTLLPANHCPGSCMFLFESKAKKVLYTGDFRLDSDVISSVEQICDGPLIDTLYLDNTYNEPSCCHPCRNDAVEMIVSLCKKYCDARIFIGTCWTGHESVLVTIATRLARYIYVEEDIMKRMSVVGVPNLFCIGKSSGLNAISNNQLTCQFIKTCNQETLTFGIKPTAMFGSTLHIAENSDEKLYVVPYSNHCNFQELFNFVKIVRPINIVPIVPGRCKTSGMESYFRADMSKFDYLLSPKQVLVSDWQTNMVDSLNQFKQSKHEPEFKVKFSSKPYSSVGKRKFASSRKMLHKRGVSFEDENSESSNLVLQCNTAIKKSMLSSKDCDEPTKCIVNQTYDVKTEIENEILHAVNDLIKL